MTLSLMLTLALACGASGDGADDLDDTGLDDGGVADDGTPPSNELISELDVRLHDDYGSLAYATWSQNAGHPVHVEYSFDGGEWLSTPSLEAAAGEHELLMVGIPYGVDVQFRLVVEDDDSLSLDGNDFTTADVPDGLPLGEVVESQPDAWLADHDYLLTSINEETGGWTGGTYWTMIIDRQGRPVWARKAPRQHWTLFAQVSVTGDHILWDEATYWSDWDEGEASTVHRTYLDAEIDQISTPGLHHAFVQLPDETLVWGSQYHVRGTEALVEMSLEDKVQDVLWTCVDDWPGSGLCESNGLFYERSTDTFLYSFYTNNSLVEIDRASGVSLWWAGQVADGYGLSLGSLQFSWQHGISYTDTGSLLLSSEAGTGSSRYTPAIEYTVDHEARRLTEIWSYNPGVYASTNGDTWRLENGNTLHIIGSSGNLAEVDPDGNMVWHVDYGGTHLLGRGQLISDLYDLVSPDASF